MGRRHTLERDTLFETLENVSICDTISVPMLSCNMDGLSSGT